MFVHAIFSRRGHLSIAVSLALLVVSSSAWAQPPGDKPDGAAPPTPALPTPAVPTTPVPSPSAPPTGRDVLAQALAPVPGGLQPRQVAERGAAVSAEVATKRAALRAANARVDQALAAYFPKATVGFSYTRLSRVENIFVPGTDFPVNSYQFTASLSVPISDYLLRLTQAYATVTLDVDGKALEQKAAALQAALDAKVAYYRWIHAHGQLKVAQLSVQQVEAHLHDAELTERAGLISMADVLRLKAQLAQARHLTRAAGGLLLVTEQQLRLRLRSKSEDNLTIGIDVMALPRSVDRFTLPQLHQRALANRLEIKALGKAKASLEEVETINRAGLYPRLDAFANAMYANPNPRIFRQAEQWDLTWDVGLRLSWTLNDTFTTLGATAEANAQVQAVDAQLTALKDGIIMAVTVAYNDLQTARSAIRAAEEGEKASFAALALRRRLLLGGKATATEIVDVDNALTQARLQRVGAHVDAHVAYARLEHAVGGFGSRTAGAKPGPRRAAAGGRAGPRVSQE